GAQPTLWFPTNVPAAEKPRAPLHSHGGSLDCARSVRRASLVPPVPLFLVPPPPIFYLQRNI
ncbi:MAG: hypothetical protein ACK5HA_09045, partial [Planctomycetaceae bacterium]